MSCCSGTIWIEGRRRPSRNMRVILRAVAALCLVALVPGAPSHAAEESSAKEKFLALKPADTSSPRATLKTFLDASNDAVKYRLTDDPRWRSYAEIAFRCLDLNDVAPAALEATRTATAVYLKEVLDRIPLPPFEEIPDADKVKADKLTRWTIPNTEISIASVKKGPREGQFLFTPETIGRAQIFYEQIRHLPFRPDSGQGAYIDYLRYSSSFIPLGWIFNLPGWAKHEYLGQQIWQWVGLLVTLLVASAVPVIAWLWSIHRIRFSRHPSMARVRGGVGPFLIPIAVAVMSELAAVVIEDGFQVGGGVLINLKIALDAIFYVGAAWTTVLLVNAFTNRVIRETEARRTGAEAQLIGLGMRIVIVLTILTFVVLAAQEFGIPLAAVFTGLGIGGLAVALAAQGTIENLLGCFVLLVDKPVQVGDFCRYGDKMGTIEEVGLRSTRIRTLDRTVVTVPNGEFSKLQIENFAPRDQILILTTLGLRYETTPDQMSAVLSGLHEMLLAHPDISNDSARVRFVGFGTSSLEIEIFAYVLTNDSDTYLEIRQGIFLRMMDIIESAGTALALPTEAHYVERRDQEQFEPVERNESSLTPETGANNP